MIAETSLEVYPGTKVKPSVVFRDTDHDTEIDPGNVELVWTLPDDTETTYVYGIDPEIVKSAVGIYYAELVLDDVGRHRMVWNGLLVGQVPVYVQVVDIPAWPQKRMPGGPH